MANMADFGDEGRVLPAENLVDKPGRSSGEYAKGIVLGLLGGAVVGAALALLTTPKTGREIREDLADMKYRYGSSGNEVVDTATEQARMIVNDGRRRADVMVDDARRRASSLLGDAERIVQDARRKAKGATGKGADDVKAKAEKLAEATRAGVEAFKEELGEDPRPQATESKSVAKSAPKPESKPKGDGKTGSKASGGKGQKKKSPKSK